VEYCVPQGCGNGSG